MNGIEQKNSAKLRIESEMVAMIFIFFGASIFATSPGQQTYLSSILWREKKRQENEKIGTQQTQLVSYQWPVVSIPYTQNPDHFYGYEGLKSIAISESFGEDVLVF